MLRVMLALGSRFQAPCTCLNRCADSTTHALSRPAPSPLLAQVSNACGAVAGVLRPDRCGAGRAAAAAAATQRPRKKQHQKPQHRAQLAVDTRQRLPYICPACDVAMFRTAVLNSHLQSCCPDLISPQDWQLAACEGEAGLRDLLAQATRRELALREHGLNMAFRQRDEADEPIKLTHSELASLLGLTNKRVVVMLRQAMRAIPLAVDDDPVEVLYEDEDLIAVNKPVGVITAPKHRWLGGSMVNRLIKYLGREPYVLHRLDMNTSGVVMFAKRKEVVAPIHRQFRDREVQKSYLAICTGVPCSQDFLVDAPIGRHPELEIARAVTEDGKPSSTQFRVLDSNPDVDLAAEGRPALLQHGAEAASSSRGAALVSAEPHTGRTHQIRVHLVHAGYPILGDDVYGLNGPWIGRQALHAATLQLINPKTGRHVSVEAPLHEDFRSALSLLKLSCPQSIRDADVRPASIQEISIANFPSCAASL